MCISVGSSIYNSTSIYESGAGGGGTEGDEGIGSIIIPDGYKRILYIENNKINSSFRTSFSGKEIDKDCEINFIIKFPQFDSLSSSKFQVIASSKATLMVRDWTQYVGTTYFEAKFFSSIEYGSTINDVSNQEIKVKLNKDALYFNDTLISSISGSEPGSFQYFDFPQTLENELSSRDVYIYKFNVKKGNSYIYDCLPVVEIGTGKIGLFDFVDNLFFETVNSIAGPEIPY